MYVSNPGVRVRFYGLGLKKEMVVLKTPDGCRFKDQRKETDYSQSALLIAVRMLEFYSD